MAKWRMLEHKSVGFGGQLCDYAGKDVFVTFINNGGRPDVTTGRVRDKGDHVFIANPMFPDLAKVREGQVEIAWMPAVLPKPFYEGTSDTEWIPIDQGLPKIGEDVFITVQAEDGTFVVEHSRLSVSFIFKNECAFYDTASCNKHIGDYVSRWKGFGTVLAWRHAKLPKPFDITKMNLAFRPNRQSV